jgi:hypothetical protein
LTAQEQENIEALADISSDNPPISVSDSHTAMEFYRFADSTEAFSELTSASLAYLYFLKVQDKPAGYDSMNEDEKRTWKTSRVKTIRKFTKHKLIAGLLEAVRHTTSI